ncbi:MAG TPA: hypothetical protein VF646_17680 [Cytophagales bacterium]
MLLIPASCICPEGNSIFFDKQAQVIQIESEKFYIQQVEIKVPVRGDSYSDSTLATIQRVGSGQRRMDLKNISKAYRVTGGSGGWLNDGITYRVQLKKFKQYEEAPDAFDNEDLITFWLTNNDRRLEKYSSGHPCP